MTRAHQAVAVVLGCGLLALACGPATTDPAKHAAEAPQDAGLFGLPAASPAWYERAMAATNEADLRAAIPYAKVEFEHLGSALGSWPSYRVTLGRDGRAEFFGNEQAVRTGLHVGAVEPVDYARLCLLLEQAGFFALDARYASNWSCGETDWIRVWRTDESTPTIVEDYESAGPLSLWGLRVAIEGVASSMVWTPAG